MRGTWRVSWVSFRWPWAQAAAVIAAQHLDYPTYLARLRTVPVQDLLKRAIGEPYPYSVADAIVLALDALEDGDPAGLCRGLINVVALLSTAGVSRALLYAAGQQGLLQHPGTETPAAPESIDEALGRLASASLLTFSTDDATVTAHRLTMRVGVERQARDGPLAGLGAGVAALLEAVTESLPEPWQNRPAARNAIQQIMALHEHLAPYLGDQDVALTERLLRLRGSAIWCLGDLGDSFAQAIEYGQDLMADRERMLGETDPHTLLSRANLAHAYWNAGRLDEAIPLLERALGDCERVLGRPTPIPWPRATTWVSPTRMPGAWMRRSHYSNVPLPTASGTSARPTPIPWPPATTSLPPTRMPGGWMRRSHYSNVPLATASGCWTRATHSRWAPATTLPTPIGSPGGWMRRSRCWSAPLPTTSGCWARPTPAPWPPATTWLSPIGTLGGWMRLKASGTAPSLDVDCHAFQTLAR